MSVRLVEGILGRLGYRIVRRPCGSLEVIGFEPRAEVLLAGEIARVLAAEPVGLPLGQLARRVKRREGEVRRVLRADRRFERSGAGRGARWRLEAPPGALGRGGPTFSAAVRPDTRPVSPEAERGS